MDEIIVLVNREGQLLGANRALSRWGLGDVIKVLGTHFHDVIHHNCNSSVCYLQVLWYRLKNFSAESGGIHQEINDVSLNRWIHVSLEPIKLSVSDVLPQMKQLPHAMIKLRDVTLLRQRQEIESRRTRFEVFNFVLRGLVHEIRNPLAAMRTTVEVLKENLSSFAPGKVVTYLDRVIESTERLQAITEKTARSKYLPDLEPKVIPLRFIFQRVQRLFEDEFRLTDVHLAVTLPESDAFPMLNLDLIAIEEVIVNLLKNALEASQSGYSVTLSYLIHWPRLTIIIEDMGHGIDQQKLTTLSIPLLSSEPGGLGLGLAYSNYLTRKMGGRFEVVSEQGKGTRIMLTFPMETEFEAEGRGD